MAIDSRSTPTCVGNTSVHPSIHTWAVPISGTSSYVVLRASAALGDTRNVADHGHEVIQGFLALAAKVEAGLSAVVSVCWRWP